MSRAVPPAAAPVPVQAPVARARAAAPAALTTVRRHAWPALRPGEGLVLANLGLLFAMTLFNNLVMPYRVVDLDSAPFVIWLGSSCLGLVLTVPLSLPRFAAVRERYGGRLLLLGLAVAYAPVLTPLRLHGNIGCVLAGTLLVVAGRLRWLLAAAQVAAAAVLDWYVWPADSMGLPDAERFTWVTLALGMALSVYAVSRLGDVLDALHGTRAELAATTAAIERLRAGRDAHDILGLSLTAVILRLELARRGLRAGRDVTADIDDVAALTAQVLVDARTVAVGEHAHTLPDEAARTREMLAWAGVEASFPTEFPPLPPDVDATLALVLREAITNVLRHSGATWCTVTACQEAGEIRLTVENDGAGAPRPADTHGPRTPAVLGGVTGSPDTDRPAPCSTTPGTGTVSAAARLAAHGGHLDAGPVGDRYRLTARIPVRGNRIKSGAASTGSPRQVLGLAVVFAAHLALTTVSPTYWQIFGGDWVLDTSSYMAVGYLLLLHIGRPRPPGRRARGGGITLVLLLAVPAVAVHDLRWFPYNYLIPFGAAVLLRYPGTVGRVGFGATAVVGGAVAGGALPQSVVASIGGFQPKTFVSYTMAAFYFQFLLYAVCRLTTLREELDRARAELAASVSTRERLRFGRDLRDRLGSGLFTVGRSTRRARAALDDGRPDTAGAALDAALAAARRAAEDVRTAARGAPAPPPADRENLIPGS
ncbi:sensor histidine kinase [Yinghuangia seranimata]|uniref:sensor histidine kinase n=1 Tax=Yinghuangia seranimata TaxID=408067 RepID=UPI00248C1280|nr:sensor histidine kinase [Yinghuangia seranimata]MDI2129874.1 histidine kinase [Yinghuangia seranimata]